MYNNNLFTTMIVVLVLCFWAVQSAAAQTVDNRIYAELLKKYVTHGKVDYQGFQ